MVEGLLSGVVGAEDEKPEPVAAEPVAGAEAFAAAVAAIASRQDPAVARKTEEFLSAQSELLTVQKKHLEDEHPLRLDQLRHQSHLLRGQRVGQAIRIAFQVVTALIAIVIGVGIVVLLRDAFTSRNVVIEPFQAPPPLAARGVTGKVVASGLLDELTRLRSGTHITDYVSNRALQNAWSGEVQFAVPEAGISVGELSRLLKARFGHDLHISGDLVETATDALALTVRGEGIPPKTFGGSTTELGTLTAVAAEYVYGQAQPVPWLSYMVSHGRYEEAIAFAQRAFVRTDKEDRPRLLIDWAIALNHVGRFREALPVLHRAVALNPQYYSGYHILADTLVVLGDEEGAWRAGEDMRRVAGGRPGRAAEVKFDTWDDLTWNLMAERDAYVADRDSNGGVGIIYNEGVGIADLEARLHDWEAAELALQTITDDPNDPDVIAWIYFVNGRLAMDAGDTARAVSDMEAFGAKCSPHACVGNSCWIAPAEEAAGHPDKADSVLKTGGTFVDCYRFRGDSLGHRGDWAAAQKAYAEAVALAPDLPAGYYSWGMALAKHGDLAGAESKLKDANRRGPHWADPLKAWGDVLVKQGHWKEALAKYDEALKYAPNWKQLKESQEAVAKHQS